MSHSPIHRHPIGLRQPLGRFTWVILLAILLTIQTLMGSGCQSPSPSSAPSPTNSKAKTRLTFWTLQMGTFAPYMENLIAQYENTHPSVDIHWVDVPFNQGEKRVLTAILSDQVPDVVNLNPEFSAILASRHALLDLRPRIEKAQWKQFLPAAWEASTTQLASAPGIPPTPYTFGIPWYLTSKVTLFNRTLLRQAGWTGGPPTTYEELATLGKRLHDKKLGYVAMPTLTENGAFLKALRQAGIPLYDPKTGLAIWADHGAGKHLAYWKRLLDNHAIPAESMTEGHQGAVDRYQSGALAMLLTGPNFLNIIEENAPSLYQTTGIAPQFPAGAPFKDFSTMVLVIPQKSQHPQEALDFALFVTNAANQGALCDLAPVLPSQISTLQSPRFQKPKEANDPKGWGRFISAQQLLQVKDVYSIRPKQSDINRIVDYYVQGALLGKWSPDAAMVQAQQRVNTLIQEDLHSPQ